MYQDHHCIREQIIFLAALLLYHISIKTKRF